MRKPKVYRPPLTADSIRTDQLIAEAVLAERERCAKIAGDLGDHFVANNGNASAVLVADHIAAAIRASR